MGVLIEDVAGDLLDEDATILMGILRDTGDDYCKPVTNLRRMRVHRIHNQFARAEFL